MLEVCHLGLEVRLPVQHQLQQLALASPPLVLSLRKARNSQSFQTFHAMVKYQWVMYSCMEVVNAINLALETTRVNAESRLC
mmetsp:Transcript_35461/g.57963  ORF Transcript_35461/g.57963 Transcript_35461/m.57963 type:complete len:82 (+) Transcript_35461:71-316(+)